MIRVMSWMSVRYEKVKDVREVLTLRAQTPRTTRRAVLTDVEVFLRGLLFSSVSTTQPYEEDEDRKWTFHNLTLLDHDGDAMTNVDVLKRTSSDDDDDDDDALETCIRRIRDTHAKEIVRFAAMLTKSSMKLPRRLYVWRTL